MLQGTPDVEDLATVVLDDILPPTCLASDLKALDDAYIADDCNAPTAIQSARQSLFGYGESRRGSVALPVVREEMSLLYGSSDQAAKADGKKVLYSKIKYSNRRFVYSCIALTAVLLSPIVLMLFAILETFILLSISLLLCMYII